LVRKVLLIIWKAWWMVGRIIMEIGEVGLMIGRIVTMLEVVSMIES